MCLWSLQRHKGTRGRLPDSCTAAWGAAMVTAVERSVVTDAAGSMHGFPAALTSFVGRAGVVDEVAGHLGQYRLVTVTGPGVSARRGWPAR